jgi:hypothetical protein
MAIKSMVLMFNKSNGELIGDLPPEQKIRGLNGNEVMTKVVEYDPSTHVYIGTYHEGKVVAIDDIRADDVPVIDEEILNLNVKGNIEGEYPLHKQLNIMMEMLNNSSISNTEEFQKMYDYIKDERERNKARKDVYKSTESSYIFISKENIKLAKDKKLGKA